MPRNDVSWLLESRPPYDGCYDTSAQRLWWAVLRQSGDDLRWAHKQLAIDALEFLRDTGQWLLENLFLVSPNETQTEIVVLIERRNRAVSRRQRL